MTMNRFLLAAALLTATAAVAERTVVDQWFLAVHTEADLHSAQTAIEAFAIDNKHYPQAKDYAELATTVAPKYIRTMPLSDAWGTPYVYRAGAGGKSYTLASAGSDRAFDESTWSTGGYTLSSKDDMVLKSDGTVREWQIQKPTCR
jgi:Type II secretion system (T2SS), protein G